MLNAKGYKLKTNSGQAPLERRLYMFKNKIFKRRFEQKDFLTGQAALVVVLFFLFTSIVAAGGLASFAAVELRSSGVLVKSKQSHKFTEGVSEDAAYRIISGKNTPSQFSYSDGTLSATATVTVIDEDSKDVLTEGAQLNFRRAINLSMGKVYEIEFKFGGLVGEGGIFMQNNSAIAGNIHTNGSVAGQNSPTINGNASAVGTISDPPQVLGAKTEGASSVSMPVQEFVMDDWERTAEEGGVYSGSCPYRPANGTMLGPIKIPCDMEIEGTNEIIMTGKIWIAGDLDIENSGIIRLDPSYGLKSEVIIAHDPSNEANKGIINLENSAQLLGSGTDGSYIMVVSRNNSAETGGPKTAIGIKNSSSASIYYAPHGKVTAQNNIHLKTITAWRLEMKNEATVEYEEQLSRVKIPALKWAVTAWQEKP